jgi:putative hydrolase of HD superfamily
MVDGQWRLFDLGYELEVQDAAAASMTLVQASIDFARIERVPRYDCESRENNAEHSFMLGIVATDLAIRHYPGLDNGLVSQFSLVHDLPELETDDVATFAISDSALAAKSQAEHNALPRVLDRLTPAIGDLLLRYEEQSEPEARLVRLVDKALPVVVDILGPGKKVMNEDYNVYTVEQLDSAEDRLQRRFRDMFPEQSFNVLHAMRDTLAARFRQEFASN